MSHDVFISYSSKNATAAEAVCHVLEENGIRCWIAPRNIAGGSKYGDLIEEAIKECQLVVVLFSKTAASSAWVNGELNLAFSEQKLIVPFRLDDTPLSGQAKLMLTQVHWIDAYPDFQNKFRDLLYAVNVALGRTTEKAEPNQPKSKSHITRKQLIIAVAAIVVICAGIFLVPWILEKTHSYKYDKNGIHVNIKGLTQQQETALTEILDNMTIVEGGTFTMGFDRSMSDYATILDSVSMPAHSVSVSDYYISRYEVTQNQWIAFMPIDDRCSEDEGNKAVEMLSWEDAMAFTDTLSRITNLSISLPTEAQWEYAARGGNRSKGYLFAGTTKDPTIVGWTSFDDLSAAHEVGGKLANELDLFDMTGNVSEWCKDRYAPYDSLPATNPQGPANGTKRVYRGGNYLVSNLFDIKTTVRYCDAPYVRHKGIGMRLVINNQEQ